MPNLCSPLNIVAHTQTSPYLRFKKHGYGAFVVSLSSVLELTISYNQALGIRTRKLLPCMHNLGGL